MQAIDVLPDGIVILDQERRYVMWNRRYAEIYHHSADLFVRGGKFEDTLQVGIARGAYPEAVGREEAWLAERLELLNHPVGRHEQRLIDGRWILIEEHRTPEDWIVGVRVDITELKQKTEALEVALRQAEESDKAKTRFLAVMSHEVRTPLNGVMGIAEALSRTPLADDQRELVATILDSARTLNHLLTDVLEFSRLDAAKVALITEPLAVEELVRRSAALFRPSAEAKGLRMIAHVEPSAAVTALGDRARLGQILNNLVSNAVKFTETGEVAILASAVGEGDRTRVTIRVRDTGVGFSPDAAERLFRPFEQADASTTRSHGGAGLGLAICRQLTEMMSGALTARSALGQGSEFVLELDMPLAGAPQAAADAPGEPLAAKVLLAEDNPTNRKVVSLILAALGLDADWAPDGQAAVEAASAGDYDLILMDLHMPRLDGWSAIREIRASEVAQGRDRTPIVVLSADIDEATQRRSFAAGADGHLGKPIRSDELLACVLGQLEGRPERAAVAG
ncbi:MAG: ATP-binding protein [Phenylobacterium sp.]